ncbi:MAG: MltA domain-containing protein [Desulfuromonadales bacterium]|nr:MltA domain-containing protein [Desulfuromonadales bacterium]
MRAFFCWVLLLLLTGCFGGIPGPEPPPRQPVEPLVAVDWSHLPGWQESTPAAAVETFIYSCQAIGNKPGWEEPCKEVLSVPAGDEQRARQFFERHFVPHQVRNEDGSDQGKITGYYVPELNGSRTRTEQFRYPLYRQPADLLTVDLSEVYPELAHKRLRGRLDGNRVIPYFDRAEIDNGENPLDGNELFWVEDPVELFFLHIQGSGRIRLENGELVMVNYANQNGHRYRSIGKLLLERNEMTRDQMSMQNIRSWVRQNPEAGRELLEENPSYVFFRELPAGVESPPGALGVPLTAERSIAVDRRTIPLGAPVFLSTTWPTSNDPLQRLMVAQDTGGAIKGQVRADFFWGLGEEAGALAGRMKQPGRMWVLLPKGEATVTRSQGSF